MIYRVIEIELRTDSDSEFEEGSDHTGEGRFGDPTYPGSTITSGRPVERSADRDDFNS